MVAPYKIEEVTNIADKVSHSKIIGLVDIKGIPSKQFQQMRQNLRGKVGIKVGRNTILKRALEKANLKKLEGSVDGSNGLVFTDLSLFQLNNLLKENKSFAPAKSGELAPYDIIIPAGDTSLRPGPILGELQAVGIKARIKNGKILITQNSLVVKKGESISKELANILPKFGIEHKEISLNMKAAYDEFGTFYNQEVLEINQDTLLSEITTASKNAFGLAFSLKFFTSQTLPLFIQDAYHNAFNVALNAEILIPETASHLLQKAYSHASSLSKIIPEEKPEEPVKEKEEVKAVSEKKPEEASKPTKDVKKSAEKPTKEGKQGEVKGVSQGEVTKVKKSKEEVKKEVKRPDKKPLKVLAPVEKPNKSVKGTPKSKEKPEAKPAEEPKLKEKPINSVKGTPKLESSGEPKPKGIAKEKPPEKK